MQTGADGGGGGGGGGGTMQVNLLSSAHPIVSGSSLGSGSGSHVRRMALPHHALTSTIQCKVHTLLRPTNSLEDIYHCIVTNTSSSTHLDLLQNDAEITITATLFGFGRPMHSLDVSPSTRSSITSKQDPTSTSQTAKSQHHHHNNKHQNKFHSLRHPKDIIWDEVLDLPVRWKDLLRDACIAFDIAGPSGEQLWGTTLSLFDSNGLLRSGKIKLQLYPNTKAYPYYGPKVCQTPGLAYSMPSKMNACLSLYSRVPIDVSQASTTTTTTTTTSAPPVTTTAATKPQIYQHYTIDDLRSEWWSPFHQQPPPRNDDVESTTTDTSMESHNKMELGYGLAHEAVDYKWKASLILEQLQSKKKIDNGYTMISNNGPSKDTATITKPGKQTSQQVKNDPTRGNKAYWLDNFTMERCRQMISDDDDSDDDYQTYASHLSSPEYCLHTNSYLIVELPIFNVPVVYEEQFYPHNLQGASGSVTALDLALHKRHVLALAAIEHNAAVVNATGDRAGGGANVTLRESPQIALLKSKVAEEQDAGISLVQFLDPEREDNNPAEDKYRTLAHDLLRGVVDPTVKPNKEQRDRLLHIISSPAQYNLTREEKDLLWRFRFSLVDNRRALTKFLLAVDWTEDDEVVQAAELLEQWRERSPIQVTDALKLLGKHVAFQTSLVRSYAIDTLANAPDDELQLYLLQLVQALKYEVLTIDDAHRRSNNFSYALEQQATNKTSSLALFLIDRASKSMSLANYLYWYLKVEMLEDANSRERYRIVFTALKERLSQIYFGYGDVPLCSPSSNQQQVHHNSLSSIIGTVTNKLASSKIRPSFSFDIDDGTAASSSSFATRNKDISLWERLLLQDKFITGIMECQMESREFRGKKDVKERKLHELLSDRGYHSIDEPVPIPSAPQLMTCGVNPSATRMFKSALYPAVVEFRLTRDKLIKSDCVAETEGNKRSNYLPSSLVTADESLSPRDSSGNRKKTTSDLYLAMFKTGDDLRQDQLVVMMIRLMDGLLKQGALDLCLRSYSILATSPTSGLVEFVSGSIPISQVLANNNGSILQYFQKVGPSAKHKYNVDQNVMETYIRSCAGFCVISFLLGIGDRHLDNIMLLPSGHFFHIDFGFIFGRDPKPLPPPFRLTREMVDGMGGTESPEYSRFCSLACQAYNTLRKHAGLILNLLHLMSDAGIADLSNSPIADAEGIISKVAERFRLELSDEQAESFFLGLINESLAALAPRVMEVLHQLAVARR